MRYRAAITILIAANVVANWSAFAESDETSGSKPAVTFARDIAPLLQRHCQDCHRPGQSTPMSLLSYAEARPWAKSIQQKVASREMPPFQATGPVGRYKNDPRLTDKEIDLVVRWVNSGAPQGNPMDLPEPRTWGNGAWAFGDPDLVVTMPRYDIRADGIDDNVNLFSESAFPEDLWLRAIEVRPSGADTIHHANVFITLEGELLPEDLRSHEMSENIAVRQYLMQWLPGRPYEFMPPDQAYHIQAGRHILLNVHYAPTTELRSDQTQIGLFFFDGEIHTLRKQTGFLTVGKQPPIAAYNANHRREFKMTLESEVTITDLHFHMHYRGKSGKVNFLPPGGTLIQGVEVPRYSFDWQRQYALVEPIQLPAGTEVVAELVWDNSSANPRNPDPSQTVQFGRKTTDEMGGVTIGFLDAGSVVDPPIVVRNGRRIDNL